MLRQKKTGILIQVLALATFLFSLSLFADELQAAQLSAFAGTVKIIDQSGGSRPAAVGAEIMGEEIIETGAKSKATVLFDDGSRLELGQSTRMKVNDEVTTGAASVMLYLGRLFAHIVPVQSTEPVFSVQTLTSTAGVRGTEFEVAAGLDGGSLVSVQDGRVDVDSEQEQISVKAGEEANVSYEGAISKGARGQRSDEEWQKWFSDRQQFFVEHSDQVLTVLNRRIERNRNRIMEQDKKMEVMKKQLATAYGSGNISYRQVRNEVARQIRIYMREMVEMSRADNNLVAVDFLISKAGEEIKLNPDAFNSDFKAKVADTRARLDAEDIAKIHKQTRQFVGLHFLGIMKAAKKFGLQQEVWRNLPPKTREQIIKRWQEKEQRKTQP